MAKSINNRMLIIYFEQSLDPDVINFNEIYGDEYTPEDFKGFIEWLKFKTGNEKVEKRLKAYIHEWHEDIETFLENFEWLDFDIPLE